jgi:RNA polymerase sigma factor (sigma-70 family)
MITKTSRPRKTVPNQADQFQKPVEMNTKREPLTEQQQALAVRYLPLARSLARTLKQNWPMETQEFDSAALLALVEAAQSFDPARNVKFATYARYRICGALRDVQRALIMQGWRDDLENAPKFMTLIATAEEFGEVMLCHPDRPVGEDVELADLLENWLKKLPPRHAAACRELYLNQKTQSETAEAIGVSKSRVSYLHREALEILNDIAMFQADAEEFLKGKEDRRPL